MASGMKTWIGSTLVGFALVAIWLLPPHPWSAPDRRIKSAERHTVERLKAEVSHTARVLQRTRWFDSLSALVPPDGTSSVLIYDPLPTVEPDLYQALGERLEEAVEALGSDRAMKFAYALQPENHGAYEHRHPAAGYTETFVGVAQGKPFCMRVLATNPAELPATLERRMGALPLTFDLLGPCTWYVRFGNPGPQVERWLEGGGFGFMAGSTPLPTTRDFKWARRSFFGFPSIGSTQPVQVDQCLAGKTEACEQLFLQPTLGSVRLTWHADDVRSSPSVATERSNGATTFDSSERYMFAELEAAFGADAVARFWMSDLPVDQAFSNAFGLRPGEWVVRWLTDHSSVTIVPPGPGLPRSATTGSMLTFALFLGIAWSFRRGSRTA